MSKDDYKGVQNRIYIKSRSYLADPKIQIPRLTDLKTGI